jgi:hypothetical protein
MIAPSQKKRKAADHYFVKGSKESNQNIIQSKDFMSEDKIVEVQLDYSPSLKE